MTMTRCRGPDTRGNQACTIESKTEVLGLIDALVINPQRYAEYASTHKRKGQPEGA